MEEIWVKVKDVDYLEVSNYGRVKGLTYTVIRSDGKPFTCTERILKPFVSNCNYLILSVKRNGKDVKKSVHRLVMESFCPIENSRYFDVNHIDGNKQNNKLDNLEWCTKEENMKHARECGLWKPEERCGEKHPMSKLTKEDVLKIKELLKTKEYKQYQIADMFGVKGSVISEIKNGKAWASVS